MFSFAQKLLTIEIYREKQRRHACILIPQGVCFEETLSQTIKMFYLQYRTDIFEANMFLKNNFSQEKTI